MEPAVFIRELRERAGVTQVEVSQVSGIHQPNVSLIESGQRVPNQRTLAAIKQAIYQVTSERFEDVRSMLGAEVVCR